MIAQSGSAMIVFVPFIFFVGAICMMIAVVLMIIIRVRNKRSS